MGKTRFVTLVDEESIATAGTKTVDLDGVNPISKLMIATRCTNNGSTPTAHPAAVVSKIELVDGSDVMNSTNGHCNQAVAFFDEGEMPFVINETENDITSGAYFHINFGRYLWDKQLAFMPDRFMNPQLKITHNKASGGSAPDAGTLSVFAQCFDNGAVSPMGFLQTKEVKSYAVTASAHEYTDLPTDYTLRKLILQNLYAGSSPFNALSTIKLSENQGQRVIFNADRGRELVKSLMKTRTVTDCVATLGTGSAVTCYVTPTYEAYYTGVGRSASQSTLIVSQGSGGTVSITNDSSESAQVIAKGQAPHGCIEIPFGRQDDPADWYDMGGVKKLELDIYANSSASSSSTTRILTQQLRKY